MHPLVAERMVERVRQRVSQGDCPTEPPLSVEKLENLVLTLADSLARSNGWQDNEALLRKMAEQELPDEIDEDMRDAADYEAGYEYLVKSSRILLDRLRRSEDV